MQLTTNPGMMTQHMRITTIALTMSLCLGWLGCKPDLQGELGDPFPKFEGMIGVWQLGNFAQQDLQSPLKEIRDLSSVYIDGQVTPLQLSLNEDLSYSVAIEKGRNYFGTTGTWGLDDPDYPTKLILHAMDELGMPSDTFVYDLGAVVRPHDNLLDIVYDRPCDGDDVLAYTFSFNRLP